MTTKAAVVHSDPKILGERPVCLLELAGPSKCSSITLGLATLWIACSVSSVPLIGCDAAPMGEVVGGLTMRGRRLFLGTNCVKEDA